MQVSTDFIYRQIFTCLFFKIIIRFWPEDEAMAFKFDCIDCRQELNRPGAILFSAPIREGVVLKYHVCAVCEITHLCLIAGCLECGTGVETGLAQFKASPDMGTFNKIGDQSVETRDFHICERCWTLHLARPVLA